MTASVAAQDAPVATYDGPYVGLKHYTEREARMFFGRGAETAVIIGNLRAARLTLLFAESGVGKSSLLRAGVAAELMAHAEENLAAKRPARLVPVLLSAWSSDPVEELLDAIAATARHLGVPDGPRPDSIRAALSAVAEALGATVLVILDQFEEYFQYRSTYPHGDDFAVDIADCINDASVPAQFLISIRADAYAGLGGLFRELIPNVYGNFLQLQYLTRENARAAIEEPVHRYNDDHGTDIGVEQKLIDAVLDGVRRDEPGLIETTYLQLVMERLWNVERAAGSDRLQFETLAGLGGAQAIIAGHLDGAMAALSAEGQDAAAAAFGLLVTRSGTKIALSVSDLAELSGRPESELDPVLRRLAEQDLHILRPVAIGEAPGDAVYEIFHDALARPIVQWRTRFRRQRDAELEANLAAARAEAQEAQRRATSERKRRVIAVIALLVVAFVGIIATAALQHRNAKRLQKADESNQIATRLERIVGPTFGAPVSALAALEAHRLSATFNARQQVLSVLMDNPAMPIQLVGHERSVGGIALSDAVVATGSSDTSVRFWRYDGRQIGPAHRTTTEPISVQRVAFTPDGATLAAGRGDGSVDLYDVFPSTRGAEYRKTVGHTNAGDGCNFNGPCLGLAFSPNGRTLASATRDGRVRLWRVPAGKPAATRHIGDVPKHFKNRIYDVAFSPDGARLAIAGDAGLFVTHVSSSGRTTGPPHAIASGVTYSVAWAPDGRLAAGDDEKIRLWDTPDDRSADEISVGSEVFALAFADRGERLVSGGADASVTEWDVRTLDRVGPPRPHADRVFAVAISPDGKTIASSGSDFVPRLWRLDASGTLANTVAVTKPERYLAVIDEQSFATANEDDVDVRVWRHGSADLVSGPAQRVATLPTTAPIVAHPKVLATTATDYTTFELWDTSPTCTRAAGCRLGVGDSSHIRSSITALALDPTGTVLAAADAVATTLWDVSDPRAPRYLGAADDASTKLALGPADTHILVTADKGIVHIWNYARADNVELLGNLINVPTASIDELAISRDGRLLAAGSSDQRIFLWDLQDPRNPQGLGIPFVQSNSIWALAFSGDGSVLAAGDGDGTACLYDVQTLRFIGSNSCLKPSGSFTTPGVLADLDFTPSGRYLLTVGRGEPVTAWDSVLWSQRTDADMTRRRDAVVCRIAGRNLTAAEWSGTFADTELEGDRDQTCPQYGLP